MKNQNAVNDLDVIETAQAAGVPHNRLKAMLEVLGKALTLQVLRNKLIGRKAKALSAAMSAPAPTAAAPAPAAAPAAPTAAAPAFNPFPGAAEKQQRDYWNNYYARRLKLERQQQGVTPFPGAVGAAPRWQDITEAEYALLSQQIEHGKSIRATAVINRATAKPADLQAYETYQTYGFGGLRAVPVDGFGGGVKYQKKVVHQRRIDAFGKPLK